MIEVTITGKSGLTDAEKENVSENGFGSDYATYLRIKHNGETILLESDAMEPEDAIFRRDLSWIKGALEKCYALGLTDAKEQK